MNQNHSQVDSAKVLKRAHRRSRRRGSVELEAVLITGLMFPLAVALYYMAIRGFSIFYRLIAGVLEWPFL